MATIRSLSIESADSVAAQAFYDKAFGLGDIVTLREAAGESTGFRGFTVSLLVAQPSTADSYLASAAEAGATVLKPGSKSLWGYGGVVQAPDGTIWKVATSSKKDKGPATREVENVVLLLGADDVKATKAFYVDRGVGVDRSFGGKYVEMSFADSPVSLSLYQRKDLAKDAGVAVEGSGSHRLVIEGDLGAFTDPNGFVWE
ncbi:VOC family protein [Luteipulveratus halotolerans]|uniref:Glyoxalase n=1 Tax=Luteipulveratus halotolerans TaxID=1631356 RepID=A0A0L6CH19_9MICO|nr:glyoxalase [Luteipulveratus halotolerans]KNX37101.1 glyoxalase [Luteipulveratus halotolerans]